MLLEIKLKTPERKFKPHILIRGPKVTWTEIGIWLLLLYGAFLGSLKRFAPFPDEFVSIVFDALSFGILALVLIKQLVRSRKIPYSPITLHLLLFMGFAFLTIFNPILTSFSRGIIGWRFLASSLLFHFLGFYAFEDVRRVHRFMVIFWLVAGVVSFFGVMQLVRGYSEVELAWINDLAATMRIAGTGRYRLMATMGSAVDLGFLMTMAFTSLFGFIVVSRRPQAKLLLLLALLFIAVVFTFVRAAWFAIFVGVFHIFVLNLWHNKRLRPIFPVLGFGLLIFFILLPLFLSYIAPIFENPALQERVASLSNPFKDKSMIDRYERWSETWQFVKEYPFGIGVGMTGATTLRYLDNPGPVGVTIDNSYLKILIETGWIGLFLFFYLLNSVVVKGTRILYKLGKPYKNLGLPLLSSFVAFIAILLFGEYIELNPCRTYIWIFTGFLFSLPRLQTVSQKQVTNQEKPTL